MTRGRLLGVALDSVADGLLDLDDLEAIARPMTFVVLCELDSRQLPPDDRLTNGPAWYCDPGRNTADGPGSHWNPGRPADRTSTKSR